MKSHKHISHIQTLCLVATTSILALCFNNCRTPKNFTDSMLFSDSFYRYALCGTQYSKNLERPRSKITAYYLGFRQQYVVNNDRIELSNVPARASAVHDVSLAIDKANAHHNKLIPPRDSDELFIIEINKYLPCSGFGKRKLFSDDTGIFYLLVGVKYAPFTQTKNGPIEYKPVDFGHAYLGHKQGTNNILFYANPKIKHNKCGPGYYLKHRLHDKTTILLEDYVPNYLSKENCVKCSEEELQYYRNDTDNKNKRRTNTAKTIVADTSGSFVFNYMVIGHTNQIGGNKYLDICLDTVFDSKFGLKFVPYNIDSLKPEYMLKKHR